MDSTLLTILASVISAGVTGGVAVYVAGATRRKTEAEAKKIEADATHVLEEVKDLNSARLLREIDRLDASNEQQAQLINQQRGELESLRREILAYAMREHEHAVENASLRHRISELEKNPNIEIIPLREIFPPRIPHEPNEFDDPVDDGPAEPPKPA